MPATCKLPMDFERLREQLKKVVQLRRDHTPAPAKDKPTAAEPSGTECSRAEPSGPECPKCSAQRAAVGELTAEGEKLRAKLQQKAVLGAELEDQLVRVLEKNTKLTLQNTDLQAQVHHLQHVSADGRAAGVASSSPAADNLESILKQMREASEKRKELERLHTEALAQLRDTQNAASAGFTNAANAAATAAANAASAGSADKTKSFETIDALQSKIRELEKKTELQNVRHEELMLEMASIKRSTQATAVAKPAPAWKQRNQDVSPESDMSTPEPAGRSNASAMDAMLDQHTMGGGSSRGRVHAQQGNTDAYGASGPAQRPVSPGAQPSSSSEIDRIMAKIEQDNRILAELDKTRSTIGVDEHVELSTSPPASAGTGRQLPNCHSPERVEQHREAWTNYYLAVPQISFGRVRGTTASNRMAVASQGSSLDHASAMSVTQHGDPMPSYMHQPPQQHQHQPPGMSMMSAQAQQATMTQHLPSHMQPQQSSQQVASTYGKPASAYMMSGQSAMATGHYGLGQQPPRLMPQIPVGVPPPPIPTILTTQYDVERLYSAFPGAEHLLGPDNKVVDMLDIPGKGRCYVYIARYSYDPFQQSPNDNPEAELPVHAGDYLLVWGNMDEDGFYDGELLDGRRGLVPSNFIQKLVGEDLLEFHQAAVLGLRDCDDSVSTNVAHEFDFHTPGDMSFLMGSLTKIERCEMIKALGTLTEERVQPLGLEDTYGKHCMPDYTYMDLEDILEEEDDALNEQLGEGPVPPPKQLTLERQLNKSVLIGWNAPDSGNPIDSYHVYVDGVLKTTVKASERTRALVEGVDSNRPHRISVRSITPNRRTSRDAACTMVIGKQVPLGPSHVKAAHVSSTSAVISWLPSNSNHQHAVCVNNVEVRTVKPGVYRHTITGLAPNTVYRVTVRAKNIRAPQFDEKQAQQIERFSCHIDFRTLPKGKGLPDPPADIMVEAGPQDGTLLVTWLPVAMNASTSGAPVTGYAVYADGKKVTDVDSPTGDHALIDINKLLGLNPKQVTVRTKSRDSQSSDSVPTPIPSSALKGKAAKDAADKRRYGNAMPAHMRTGTRRDAHGQVVIDTDENLSDKEIYPNHMSIPAIEITKDSASEGNFSEDDYVDGRARGGRQQQQQQQYVPRSHAERGRPPTLPHERAGGRLDHQQQQQRRDRAMEERDQYYMDGGRSDPRRGPHPGDRGYRGPPPGRGGPQHPGGGPPRGGPADKRMRWFVALFDYDPTTMSPNPDACEEELPFSEGDPIKIYGEKDADGFYWGECRGRRGFVPHNMVVEVQDMPKNAEAGRGAHGRDRDRWGDIYASMPVKKMIALYDYDPQELSPNVDAEQVELTFSTGNVIYVYGEMDDDGFFMGELDGTRGLVPSNFLTEAPPDYAGGGVRRGPPPARGMGGGHGPGARGPPPPPRDPRMDPRDRRKDACLPTQIDYRPGDPYHHQGPGPAGRGRGEGRGALRGGRGGGPPPPGGWGPRGPPPDGYRQHPNQDHHPQDDLGYGPDPAMAPNPATARQPAKPLKGVPAVVPDFVIPNAADAPPVSALPKFPEAPNLMQKLSEMTGGADTSVDNLLSKGKELIFMKFGLGK